MGELALTQANTCTTPWISLVEFQKLLGVQEDEYRQFKDFNQHVIKKAMIEINQLNLKINDVEFKREQRRVTALRFTVTKNLYYQPSLNLEFPALQESNNATKTGENNTIFLERLLSFGLTEQKAKKFLNDYDEKRITENLDIVEKNCRAGNVANVPAYAMAALKEDYRPKETFLEKEKKAKAAQAKAQAENFKRQELLKRLYYFLQF